MDFFTQMRYNGGKQPARRAIGGIIMNKVRFGIVGMGVQGSLYASILTGRQHPGRGPLPQPEGCVLTAISSRQDQSGKAAELGVSYFADWKALIDSGECDCVILTVPHFRHHEIAIYAMEKGVNVLCEKPAGVRASDVRKMLAARERTGAKLGMFLQQRTIPLFRRLRQIIDSGALGRLRRSNWIINTYWRPDSYYASAAWRGTWKGEGGGILVNQLPHYLDLWQYLCGVPEQVYAVNRHGAFRSITVENDVTVLAEYPGGGTGVFVACTHDPMGTDRLEMDFDGGKIIVENSSRATVHRFSRREGDWNRSLTADEMERFVSSPDHHTTEILDEGLAYGVSHARILENFARHIRLEEPLVADGEAGLAQVELANAIALSGWLKSPVSVPCDSARFDEELQKRMDAE